MADHSEILNLVHRYEQKLRSVWDVFAFEEFRNQTFEETRRRVGLDRYFDHVMRLRSVLFQYFRGLPGSDALVLQKSNELLREARIHMETWRRLLMSRRDQDDLFRLHISVS